METSRSIERLTSRRLRGFNHPVIELPYSTSDTIAAIATPAGRGGIGVVRLSGPDAPRIAGELVDRSEPLTPRHATFARLGALEAGRPEASKPPSPRVFTPVEPVPDRVVVTFFPRPASYTGEDVVEISAHGSPVVMTALLRAAVDRGARLAEPGEFTLRAFLHGKLDLIQAEAVADLVDAVTPLQARTAFDQLDGTLTLAIGSIEAELFEVMARLEASLDFPEEGYRFVEPREASEGLGRVRARIDALLAQAARGRLVREGAQVVIAGAPNVGKSSLFNALLNANRAIVTSVPGTTRDLVTERADIDGLSLALVDTAGVCETAEIVEHEGVARARAAAAVADLVLVVLDRSRPLDVNDHAVLRDTAPRRRIEVVNKCDLPSAWTGLEAGPCVPPGAPVGAAGRVEISVRTGDGLDALRAAIATVLAGGGPQRDPPAVSNVRHAAILGRACAAIDRARAALDDAVPEEFPLTDLQDAAATLQEITGRRTTDDLLRSIFERFCVGK